MGWELVYWIAPRIDTASWQESKKILCDGQQNGQAFWELVQAVQIHQELGAFA